MLPYILSLWWLPSHTDCVLGYSYGGESSSPFDISRYQKSTCMLPSSVLLHCLLHQNILRLACWRMRHGEQSQVNPKVPAQAPDVWQSPVKFCKTIQSRHSWEKLHVGGKLSATQIKTTDQTIHRLRSKYKRLLLFDTKALWLFTTHHYNGNR